MAIPDAARDRAMEAACVATNLAREHEEAVNRGDYRRALKMAAGLATTSAHMVAGHAFTLRDYGEEA